MLRPLARSSRWETIRALVTWQHHLGDLRWSIQARRRSKAGSLNGVQTLSPVGFTAARQRMAFDAAGNALVIWQLCDGSNCSIQLRRRAPSGDLGSVQTVSAPGPRAFDPPVAIAAKRSALAVWSAYDGTNFRIQAVRPAD